MHTGFYKSSNVEKALSEIKYEDILDKPLKEGNITWDAWVLLNGYCNIFAAELSKEMKYNAYIIEQTNKKGFHVFCQVYKDNNWYYIDVRGATSDFNEFINGIRLFIKSEFIIRKVTDYDIIAWEDGIEDINITREFALAMIKKYRNYYMI